MTWALVLLAFVVLAALVFFTMGDSSKGGMGKPSSTQTARPAVTTGAEAAA